MTSRPILATLLLAAASSSAAGSTVSGTVVATGMPHNGYVVISLEQEGLTVAPPAEPITVDQFNFEFIPHVRAIVTGTAIRYLNSDQEPHNVYSPEGRYNLGTWPPGEWRDYTYEKPGVYTQLCRIHPDMLAFIVVLDTPYFDQTEEDGEFEIENVPPGTYTLVAWSEELEILEQEVTVEEGKPVELELTLLP